MLDIKALAAELSPVIEQTVKAHVDTMRTESETSLKAIEEELTQIKLMGTRVAQSGRFTEKQKHDVITKTFNAIGGLSQVTEAQFKEAFEAQCKAAFNSEGTATEGAEFVFTQFSEDIFRVMKKYKLVNELKMFAIKGIELKIPKGINNITTAWIAEGAPITKSKAGSAFITINTFKAATLVPFTEELLQDNMTTPRYYEMIVSMIGESQGAFLEDEILNGTTATRIDGILVNASVNVATAGAGLTTLNAMTFTQVDDLITDADALIGLEYENNPEGAVAVMSKYVFNKLKRLKLTTGEYAYPDLRTANPMLMGKYRVILSHKAPMQNAAADVAGATVMVMGDFQSYFALVVSEELTLTRGYADGDFQADIQSVKARRRAGGKALDPLAFVKIKTAAI